MALFVIPWHGILHNEIHLGLKRHQLISIKGAIFLKLIKLLDGL